MTSSDDAPREDPAQGDSGLPLDEDAAWRAIVEHYGERAVLDPPTRDPHRPSSGQPTVDRGPGEPTTLPADPLEPPRHEGRREHDAPPAAERAHPSEHEHFVPPDPPPLPKPTPARRLAWSGLFVPPVLMLLAVIFAWTFPMWFSLALVAAFVGGFVFLVVTMPNGEGDDWDDGAVL